MSQKYEQCVTYCKINQRIKQCEEDIVSLHMNLERLQEEKQQYEALYKDPQFGDIVTYDRDRNRKRVMLYNEDGELRAFTCNKIDYNQTLYQPTGKNIFADNLLNLSPSPLVPPLGPGYWY